MLTNCTLDKTLYLFVHLFMQKAYRVFIQKYGNVPPIFVVIYYSIPNPFFRLFNTDFSGAFHPHFQLLCPFVKLTYLCTILICAQMTALEHRKLTGLISCGTHRCKGTETSSQSHRATWNIHYEDQEWKTLFYFGTHFLMFWLHQSKRSHAHSLKAEQKKQNSFLTDELKGEVMSSFVLQEPPIDRAVFWALSWSSLLKLNLML